MRNIDYKQIIQIARKAGDAILSIYVKEIKVELKADDSPLTHADRQSNDIIIESLSELYPDIPYISEETKQIEYEERKRWKHFWLIDPLDGTKEFIKKNGEFTVNIALIENGKPVFGVVYVPVKNLTYYGIKGKGSFKIDENGREHRLIRSGKHYSNCEKVTIVASRSHMTTAVRDFVESLKEQGKQVELLAAGSSLKFCLVAENLADVYPRFGPTMEWDTAAAQAVAEQAGRVVLRADTRLPLVYNKKNLLNPWFIVE